MSITRAKHDSRRQQAKYCVVILVGVFDAFIILGSLGFLNSTYHARVLFSGWMDK